MKKTFPFGSALIQARREQGFRSAHAFFSDCGGPRVFGMTFGAYLSIEHGRSLPKPWRLRPLLIALNLLPGSARRLELLRSYLASVLADAELVSEVWDRRQTGPEDPTRAIAEEATRMIKRKSINIELDQWKVVADDFDAYLCDYYLTSTPGFSELPDIARATGLSAARIRRALKLLASRGLAKLEGGRAKSAFANQLVNMPPLSPATAALYAAARRNRDRMIAGGKRQHDWCLVARVPRGAMPRYAHYLKQAVSVAAVYSDEENRNDTDIYAIEARITKVFSTQSPAELDGYDPKLEASGTHD